MTETQLLLSPEARLAPTHSAVVVIDMQNDFCAEGGYVETVVGRSAAACRAVVEPVMELLRMARDKGVPVFWVRAIYDVETLPAGMRAKQRSRSDAVCCATGSWGAEFFGVSPDSSDAVVDKHTYSAFIGTDLDSQLRGKGVRTLVFAGVQTNVCVESSLRDATCMGYYSVLASDCVASHAEPLHEATLKNVEFLFGDVMSQAAIRSIWCGR